MEPSEQSIDVVLEEPIVDLEDRLARLSRPEVDALLRLLPGAMQRGSADEVR